MSSHSTAIRCAALSDDTPSHDGMNVGPEPLEADKANSSHAEAIDKLWPEWARQKTRQNVRVSVIVDENFADR